MARERSLSLRIVADAKQARRELGGLAKDAEKQGGATEKALGGVKNAMLGLGIGFGLTTAIQEFDEAQKVAAQTEAVIKSTGGAANVTASQVSDLAAEMSKKTAIDDEAIQAGQNWLLTFKNVRNEAGEGNDVFNQASETMLDLSVAMGTDAKGAASLLGKALNDPISGLTALKKAGVTFTAQQRDQIKALQESGDMLGAQKIILQELESQVGGSAEAQATAWGRTQVALGNLAETVGGVLAPAIEGLADTLEPVVGWFAELDATQQKLLIGLGAGAGAWMKWGDSAVGSLLDVTNSSRNAEDAISGVNRALAKGAAVAAAGITAYNLTYEALESLAGERNDIGKLADELEALALGTSSVGEVAARLDTDLNGLVHAFDWASDGADSTAEALGYLATHLQSDFGGQKMEGYIGKVEDFDAALARMVDQGHAKEAKQSFDIIVAALLEQGLTLTEIVPLLPQYYDAIETAGKKAGVAEGGVATLTDALDDQSEAGRNLGNVVGDAYERIQNRAENAENAIRNFYDEQTGQLSGQIEALNALRAYGDQLAQNGLTTDIYTQAGADNQAALISYTQTVGEAVAAEYERTGSMEAARQKMEEYRLRLIQVMDQAGYTEDQIAFMVQQMGFNETGVFNIDASGALASLDAVQQRIDSLSLGATLAGLSGDYGGPRASGGPVRNGTTYLVGENGPELFTAPASGKIIPNHNLTGPGPNAVGGGTTVIVTLDGREIARHLAGTANRSTRATGRSQFVSTISSFA